MLFYLHFNLAKNSYGMSNHAHFYNNWNVHCKKSSYIKTINCMIIGLVNYPNYFLTIMSI